MSLKVMGIIMVIAGCGSVGFRIAANHRLQERLLRQMIGILDFMECELQYRLTPLPELCRQVVQQFRSPLGTVFSEFAKELDMQVTPDVACCMSAALNKTKALPESIDRELVLLGQSIGHFDLNGQLKGLEAVRQDCKRNLDMLSTNRDQRLRSYQTLGLCAGAALAILFI